MAAILTIGHSTRSIEPFIEMLEAHGVEHLVDVRTAPGSRKYPHFNREALAASLRERGIDYTHMKELGGFRKARPDSINAGWKNQSFRGYADYMQTDAFAREIDKLVALASEKRIAIMCSEAVPWRCHRSLIADALTARGHPVEHISDAKRRNPHKLTRFARVNGANVTYPATE